MAAIGALHRDVVTDAATDFARLLDRPAEILHVIETDVLKELAIDLETPDAARAVVTFIVDRLREAGVPGGRWSNPGRSRHGGAGRRIAEFADSLDAEMIIIGTAYAENLIRPGRAAIRFRWRPHKLVALRRPARCGMMIGCAASTGLSGCDERVRVIAASSDERPGQGVEILALRHQITVLERQLGTARAAVLPRRPGVPCRPAARAPRDMLGRFRFGGRCWCGPTRCCAGTAICWPAATRPCPARGARAGRAPSAPSACWCCAWYERTRVMWSWGLCERAMAFLVMVFVSRAASPGSP